MAQSVRTISVNLQAGTAKFAADMEKAGAKVREFAGHTVSSMQASSASIRLLEGNFTNNTRAVERFLGTTLNLGPIMQKAFPLVGLAAFAGLLDESAAKVAAYFQKALNAGLRVSQAFRELTAPLRQANDELAIANQRLENDIAKLSGKHENTIALALLEARKAADGLGDSLDKDLEKVQKLLKEESVSGMEQIFLGQAGTEDLRNLIANLRKDIASDTMAGATKVAAAKSPAEVSKAQDEMEATLRSRYTWYLDRLNEMLAAAQALQVKHNSPNMDGPIVGEDPAADWAARSVPDQAQRIGQVKGIIGAVGYEASFVPLQFANTRLTAQDEGLHAAKDNAAADRPFEDWKKKMDAQIAAVKASMEAIGKPEAAQVIAKAFGSAAEAIAEVNKALERHNKTLTSAEEQEIREKEAILAKEEAEKDWRGSYAKSTIAIDDRIKSQDLLTAVLGKGYDATRAANVETRMMQELGAHYGDSVWMSDHSSDVAAMRGGFGREFDSQQANKSGESLQRLREEIALEKDLAAAQMQGAEAVRQATFAAKLRQMAVTMTADEFKRQAAAEMDLYDAQRRNEALSDVSKINERIAATGRMTEAILKGAAAVRAATLANELAVIAREGDIPVPGMIGVGSRGLATVAAAGADHSKDVADLAARSDRLRAISEEGAKLREVQSTLGDSLEIEIQLRDLENQRLKALVEESLALRGAKDGVRAFFLEMQEDAKGTAAIIYDAMNQALDKSSNNLAKMMLEKKPKGGWGQMWGKEMHGIGEEMVGSAIHSVGQKMFGALGKHLGFSGKPDGTATNPLWVRIWSGGAAAHTGGSVDDLPAWSPKSNPFAIGHPPGGNKIAAALAGLPSLLGGGLGNLFGKGASTAVSSAISFGGFMAEGGIAMPDQAYIVGERGPEVLMGASGRIANNAEMHRTFGGGGGSVTYNVDARGSDLGARNRIQRGLEMTYRAAVPAAVQAMHERAKRTPQRRS